MSEDINPFLSVQSDFRYFCCFSAAVFSNSTCFSVDFHIFAINILIWISLKPPPPTTTTTLPLTFCSFHNPLHHRHHDCRHPPVLFFMKLAPRWALWKLQGSRILHYICIHCADIIQLLSAVHTLQPDQICVGLQLG